MKNQRISLIPVLTFRSTSSQESFQAYKSSQEPVNSNEVSELRYADYCFQLYVYLSGPNFNSLFWI